METGNVALVQEWVDEWRDLVEFEVVPVVDGSTTAAVFDSDSNTE